MLASPFQDADCTSSSLVVSLVKAVDDGLSTWNSVVQAPGFSLVPDLAIGSHLS